MIPTSGREDTRVPIARSSSLKVLGVFAVFVLLISSAAAQSVTKLKNQPPDGVVYSFQLTDGTVLVQGYNCSDFWQLTPDNTGSYVNGTWKQVASLPPGYAPDATSSAVLADGRLLLEGGEYSDCGGTFSLTNQGAIYDPVANTWTTVPPPKGWKYIGDSPSTVLANGNYLIGNKLTKQMRVLNPKTMTWSSAPSKGKSDFNAEEGWTLLADGSVLTADVQNAPNSEIYDAAAKKASGRQLAAPSSICTLRRLSVAYSTGHKASFAITRLERSARRSFDQTAQFLSPAPTPSTGAALDTQPSMTAWLAAGQLVPTFRMETMRAIRSPFS